MVIENFKFVDLFCGIGGFHQALTALGGECVFACDIDEACRETYYSNYGLMPVGDIKKVDPADIPEHEVLCGGFPCQAFSIAGKRLGFGDPTKGTLFFDIMRIVHYHHPKYILLENVRNLASHDHGNTWKIIHQSLLDAGYNVSEKPVIFSPHYIGIPQHRERVFIMAVRKDVGQLPEFFFNRRRAKPCSIYTVLQDDSEIKNVQRYRMKKHDIEIVNLWNEFLAGIRKNVKKLPCFPVTDLYLFPNLDRFDIPNMHYEKAMFARRNVELFNKAPAFITRWLSRAYELPKFRGSKRMLEWHAGNPQNPDLWETVLQFRQSGIRAREAHVFPTLTAVVQTPIVGRFKRKLTPRECARLQSFPDTFKCNPKEHEAYKQFGNSVNVEVVKLFARFLLGDEEMHNIYRKTEEDLLEEMPKKRGRPRKVYPPGQEPKRGRPRKYPLPEDGEPLPKRKRGRPKKQPVEVPVLFDEDGNPILPPKRKRGRPRKYPIPSLFDEIAPTPVPVIEEPLPEPDEEELDDIIEQAEEIEKLVMLEDPNVGPEDTEDVDVEEAAELIEALNEEVEGTDTQPDEDDNLGHDLEYWFEERERLEALNQVLLAEDKERRAIARANGYRKKDPNQPPRKRGRPRKYPLPEDGGPQPPRKRGRPKKETPQPVAGALGEDAPPKRKRGRPRKNPL
ncbi:MAG: DNA (cytosine-5-)-methyltransferase [Bacteroidales bacterium]|nr:DNA (cytosine-5-)-methyltransferase [Bacteroidales bacterium]